MIFKHNRTLVREYYCYYYQNEYHFCIDHIRRLTYTRNIRAAIHSFIYLFAIPLFTDFESDSLRTYTDTCHILIELSQSFRFLLW